MKKRALCPLSGVHLTIKPSSMPFYIVIVGRKYNVLVVKSRKKGFIDVTKSLTLRNHYRDLITQR